MLRKWKIKKFGYTKLNFLTNFKGQTSLKLPTAHIKPTTKKNFDEEQIDYFLHYQTESNSY